MRTAKKRARAANAGGRITTGNNNTNPHRSQALKSALAYAKKGWHVFPCKPESKKPATRHGFKNATTDPEQIREWWDGNPRFNVAIATGKASGLLVLDLDRHDDDGVMVVKNLHGWEPPEVYQRTGGGGLQAFYRYPDGNGEYGNTTGLDGLPAVDVRGEGGYVVVPPSVHPDTGEEYDWEGNPNEELEDPPGWLLDALTGDNEADGGAAFDPTQTIEKGERNEAAASVCGQYVNTIPTGDVWPALQAWNQRHCQPPLPETELRSVFESISRRDAETGDPIPDEDADPTDLLEAFNKRVGTHLASVKIVEGDSPELHLTHRDGRTATGTVRSWGKPHYAKGVLTSLEYRIPPNMPTKSKDWDKLADYVLRAADIADPGAEGTEAGAALQAVRETATSYPRPARIRGKTVYMKKALTPGSQHAVVCEDENKDMWVHAAGIREIIDRIPRGFSSARLSRAFASAGWQRQSFHTVEVDGDGEPLTDTRTRTSLWRVPEHD